MGSKLTLFLCVSGAALGLAACEEAGPASSRTETAASAASVRPAATKIVERDVEAPDVFQKTEAGLWDGRPSLGGVWVAHPDVTDPERVMIRNEANGKYVVGALFRRERDNPGPRFQVSSDAAEALGLLAGAPTKVNVTALRREDTPTEVPEEEAGTAEALPEAEDVQTASLEPAAGAPAATERVDAGTSSSEADAPSAAGVAGDAGATPNERAAAQDKPAKQRWNPFRRRVADPLNALSTDPVPLASAGTAVAASAAATSDTPQLAVELPPATPETDEAPQTAITATPADASASPPEKQRWNPFRRRETEPLSALGATSVSGAAAGTIVSGQGVQTDEIVTAELKPQNVSAAPPSRTTSALDQPYLQIGIFSVEGNAETTAELLRRNGVVPTVFEQETQGKSFWRVVVGPAKTARDRSALLGKVKDLGFNDAYAVTR